MRAGRRYQLGGCCLLGERGRARPWGAQSPPETPASEPSGAPKTCGAAVLRALSAGCWQLALHSVSTPGIAAHPGAPPAPPGTALLPLHPPPSTP